MQAKKLNELQLYEQNLQNMLVQKQILQTEINEINNALEEIEKLKEDYAFMIVGGIMVKKSKEEIKNELENKKKLLGLRIKSFEKQEDLLKKKAEEIRQELLKELKK